MVADMQYFTSIAVISLFGVLFTIFLSCECYPEVRLNCIARGNQEKERERPIQAISMEQHQIYGHSYGSALCTFGVQHLQAFSRNSQPRAKAKKPTETAIKRAPK